jgi:hypothetical protein
MRADFRSIYNPGPHKYAGSDLNKSDPPTGCWGGDERSSSHNSTIVEANFYLIYVRIDRYTLTLRLFLLVFLHDFSIPCHGNFLNNLIKL